MSTFANDDSEDEQWLQDHKEEHQETPKMTPSRRKRRMGKRPIRVSQTKQKCPHCGEKAVVELFRNTKCLACQVSEFLGPIH
jgi:hypothetical protein